MSSTKSAMWVVALAFAALGACGSRGASGSDGGAEDSCRLTGCDDGIFCNGTERCDPGGTRSDTRGCVAGARPCGSGVACDDGAQRCGGACSDPDADGDGHVAFECGGDDCDDTDPTRSPDNPEICDFDGHDEDCDPSTFGDRDLDGDGFVDARCCNTSEGGTTSCGEDCDDTRRGTNSNVPEVCDGRDNDCDGRVDEEVAVGGFVDADRDLHGDAEASISGCPGWPGVSASSLDCDDADPTINRPQTEIFDGKDNDCDGRIDENVQLALWYPDLDGDGFGNLRASTDAVASDRPVPNRSLLPFDCDDTDPLRSPSAEERCNARDDDCSPRTAFMIGVNDFEDDDGDGYPDRNCPSEHLMEEGSRVADCDDTDPTTHPDAPERCDGRDNDCDERIDEDCSATSAPLDGGVVESDAGLDAGSMACDGPSCVVELAAGWFHTCARRSAGTVICWGANGNGQVGDGTLEVLRRVPTLVEGLDATVEITAGQSHTCARDSTRGVVCWGRADSGQLGDGTRGDELGSRRVPTQVSSESIRFSVSDLRGISAGGSHTCALIDAATPPPSVACWGAFGSGQLGDQPPHHNNLIPDIAWMFLGDLLLIRALEVSAGYEHTCALQADNTAICWGRSANGRLGNGVTGVEDNRPAVVFRLTDVVEISAGGEHTCARRTDGSVLCWGANAHGQLGDGTTSERSIPNRVIGLSDVVGLASGLRHTCARRSDDSVVCWGLNDRGQLGDGTFQDRLVPRPVVGLHSVVEIAAGGWHNCARQHSGDVVCWGWNDLGQLGDGSTLGRVFPTRVVGL
jgi:hypothetical protein